MNVDLVIVLLSTRMDANDGFSFVHFNVRSLCASFHEFQDVVAEEKFQLIGLSETWLNDTVPNQSLYISNYNLVRNDRDGRGGGVALYIHNSLKFRVLEAPEQQSLLEQIWVSVKIQGKVIYFGSLYRPPNLNINECLDDLENTIISFMPNCTHIFFGTDFNIDVSRTDTPACKQLFRLLHKYDLSQLVQSPTRVSESSSSIIDLIITNSPELSTVVDVINMEGISDHYLVYSVLRLQKLRMPISFRTYRDYSGFVLNNFLFDLNSVYWDLIYSLKDVNEMVSFLNTNLIKIFDIHAPIKKSRFTKAPAPWITPNIKFMMKLRRRALTRYKRLKTDAAFDEYKQLRNYVVSAVRNEKKAFLQHKFQTDPRSFWKTIKSLNISGRSNSSNSSNNLNEYSPLDFNKFFIDSVPKTQSTSDTFVSQQYSSNDAVDPVNQFRFTEVTEEQINRVISKIKSAAMGPDCINIKMINLVTPCLTPHITFIVNHCLSFGVFPEAWKQADIIPVPKVSNPSELSHYRPISILPTMSKIIEKVVNEQLIEFSINRKLLPITQSGFRAKHSTTTALLHVCDDIFKALDQAKTMLLVLLDFSRAFDTLDHSILLNKLEYFGLHTSSINLIKNYLLKRCQRVRLNSALSDYVEISQGVPQGSILGPLLFSLYSCDFHKHLRVCSSHQYADDTQIYHSFNTTNVAEAVNAINSDLSIISDLCKNHKLVLNAAKSKLLVFGRPLPNAMSISMDGSPLVATNNQKNLGVVLDTDLRFEAHVSNLLQVCFYKLRILYMNKNFLTNDIKLRLCDSLILSNINYASTLLWPALCQREKSSLQKIQNACLKFSYGMNKFDHVSPLLVRSKWLSLEERFVLQLATLVHKVVLSGEPAYLYKKLISNISIHDRNTRNGKNFVIPKHKTAKFQGSFSYNAPKIYNALPPSIRSLSSVATFKEKTRHVILNRRCI